MKILVCSILLYLLSGCVHMVIPAVMSEAIQLHEMSEVNNRLNKLEKADEQK